MFSCSRKYNLAVSAIARFSSSPPIRSSLERQQAWLKAKKAALIANQQAELHLREIIKTGRHYHSSIRSQVPGITILALQDSILMGQRQLLGLRFAAVSEIIDHGAAAFNGIVDGLDNKAIDALPGVKILDDDEVASMMIGNLSEDARRAVGHMVLLQDLPPAAVGSVAEASLHQIDHRIQELQQVRQQIKAMADGTWTHPRFTSQ